MFVIIKIIILNKHDTLCFLSGLVESLAQILLYCSICCIVLVYRHTVLDEDTHKNYKQVLAEISRHLQSNTMIKLHLFHFLIKDSKDLHDNFF